ncbi:MAG: squalene synthase HpnC [Dongiaceae bacterium]
METPSGKWAETENFPVGSRLLPARLRPHVMAFYGFARAADDIADSPDLMPAEKLARLDLMEAGLLGRVADAAAPPRALQLRASLAACGVTPGHAVDLLAAFKQDAVKGRYADWADLIAYCNLSAAPVGRFLLDLHGEKPEHWRHSDALCNALQIINHLQDCQDDYRTLDRVYLPQDWLAGCGSGVADLDAAAASPGLRRVLLRCVEGTEELLAEARRLPFVLASRGLGYESAAILALAEALTRRLKGGDPLARRIALSKPAMAMTAMGGVLRRMLGYW